MDPFLISKAKIIIGIWVFFIFLLIFARIFMPEKYTAYVKEKKVYAVIIPVVLTGIAVWFTFFEDGKVRFVCRKETQRCDYYHSTLFHKDLRLTDTFSLDGIKDVGIDPYERWILWRHKTVYVLRFYGPENSFEMPKKISFRTNAEEELKKASSFLHTGKPEYLYTKSSDSAGGILFVSIFLLGYAAVAGCFTLLLQMIKLEKVSDG